MDGLMMELFAGEIHKAEFHFLGIGLEDGEAVGFVFEEETAGA
jgi:hypothetical protein